MKRVWSSLPCAALVLLAHAAAVSTTCAFAGDIRAELKEVLVADAKANLAPAPAPATPTQPEATDAVVMSPYVVTGTAVPRLGESVREPPITRLMRDGTLYENVGRRFTTRLRLRLYSTDSPLDAPMPTLFGNVHPAIGAQLGLSWSW